MSFEPVVARSERAGRTRAATHASGPELNRPPRCCSYSFFPSALPPLLRSRIHPAPAFLVSRDSVVARLIKMNYTEGMGDLNVLVMYYLAILFRVAAYLGLVAFNRDKRALPSFFDMIVEDIVTPFRELVVDLTLIGAVIPTNIRRNGIGASIRRGLGVSDQQAQQRVLDAANEVMRERVRGGTEEVGLDDLAEGDVDMRVSAAADEV